MALTSRAHTRENEVHRSSRQQDEQKRHEGCPEPPLVALELTAREAKTAPATFRCAAKATQKKQAGEQPICPPALITSQRRTAAGTSMISSEVLGQLGHLE
jgi:hypothetical protein